MRTVIAAIALIGASIGTAQASVCSDAVQGTIRWGTGASWSQTNLDTLCAGAETSTEPGACFDEVANSGTVDWGQGTTWNPVNALNLCAGTRNASATITCFKARIADGAGWQEATADCQANAGASVAAPSVGNARIRPIEPRGTTSREIRPLEPVTPRRSTPTFTVPDTDRMSERTYESSGIYVTAQRNQPTTPLEGGTSDALSAFHLGFENGDHKLNRLTLLRFNGAVQAALNDNDGNDPFTASARYVSIEGGRAVTTRGVCQGRCDVPLDGIGPNETALLTGFSFERAVADANIREVSVRLDPERDVAVAAFIDDRGIDVRSGRLRPARARKQDRDYTLTLQYLIVPKAVIKDLGRISGADRATASPFPRPARTGGGNTPNNIMRMEDARRQGGFGLGWSSGGGTIYALQGFEFRFQDKDHHLLKIGVNLSRTDSVIDFQDNNQDDPIAWSVDYALLEDGA